MAVSVDSRVTVQVRDIQAGAMPPRAPLAFPAQDLGAAFRDGAAPQALRRQRFAGVARLGVFAPAVLATGALLWAFLAWFATGGTTWAEGVLAALIGVSFFWIAVGVVTVVWGAVALMRHDRVRVGGPGRPMSVALLMPVHHEDAAAVFGNMAAMLEALAAARSDHGFRLFVLSDTRDGGAAEAEAAAFAQLRATHPQGGQVYYRRRVLNTDRKVGNIADWVENWGGAHEAMIVLDADSLMSAEAILALSDAMAADPEAGLIQSCPQLIGAQSLFARAQQFASTVYGPALAEGLAAWTGTEGNYWGHNAILRVAAFAKTAGLPHVGRKGRLILSHDFVEAGLMRRAGWAVRFLPRLRGSYEQTPPTLIDHVIRDRRWCQGNLQHLRLLGTRGLHPVSRFHLLHGAMGYVLSPLWFALLAIWALIGVSEEQSVVSYFSPDNPLRPNWPEMSEGNHIWLMLGLYALLLFPKIIGAVALVGSGVRLARLGGGLRFVGSVLFEMAIAVAYAPVLMVQQTVSVLRVCAGRRADWAPQARGGGQGYGWGAMLRFHWFETLLGAALCVGLGAGLISAWLLPIALPLLCAVPLSWLSGQGVGRALLTPQEVRVPGVAARAARWQARLSETVVVAAE